MAFLFKIEGRSVFPNEETLLIEPFKTIWGRDKDKDKANALEEFCYIEFMSSAKKTNPYRNYDEDKKQVEIVKDCITQKDWKPDELVEKAMEKIQEFQLRASVTYSYFKAAVHGAEKMKSFFYSFDMNERNPKTLNPVWKPKDITNAISDTDNVVIKLANLEKKVLEELYEETKTKANKEISPFAQRTSIK